MEEEEKVLVNDKLDQKKKSWKQEREATVKNWTGKRQRERDAETRTLHLTLSW